MAGQLPPAICVTNHCETSASNPPTGLERAQTMSMSEFISSKASSMRRVERMTVGLSGVGSVFSVGI